MTLLVENAGQVVAKDVIFSTVWPGTFVVESCLTKNISLLRKVLREGNGEGSVIQTVAKRGYRFVAPVSEEAAPAALNVAALQGRGGESARSLGWRAILAIAATVVLLVAQSPDRRRYDVSVRQIAKWERQRLVERYLQMHLDTAEMEKSLLQFQREALLDNQSAEAYSGIAFALTAMTRLGSGTTRGRLIKAQQAAARALSLDPKQAMPHVTLGLVGCSPASTSREPSASISARWS